jgi:hypothetical protein
MRQDASATQASARPPFQALIARQNLRARSAGGAGPASTSSPFRGSNPRWQGPAPSPAPATAASRADCAAGCARAGRARASSPAQAPGAAHYAAEPRRAGRRVSPPARSAGRQRAGPPSGSTAIRPGRSAVRPAPSERATGGWSTPARSHRSMTRRPRAGRPPASPARCLRLGEKVGARPEIGPPGVTVPAVIRAHGPGETRPPGRRQATGAWRAPGDHSAMPHRQRNNHQAPAGRPVLPPIQPRPGRG